MTVSSPADGATLWTILAAAGGSTFAPNTARSQHLATGCKLLWQHQKEVPIFFVMVYKDSLDSFDVLVHDLRAYLRLRVIG